MSIFQPLPDEDDRSYLRLLRLQPGDYSDPIECTLEIVTHEESKDQYEAISYCWGNSNDTIPIVCNGLHVPVTRSLESAMRRFRTPSGSTARLLWADAICINQKDDEEKGKQVGRMGEVYMNASCVLVWLGCNVNEATATSTFAFISETVQYLDEAYLRGGRIISSIPRFTEPFPICLEEGKWLQVAALLQTDWFWRMWALQEVGLAKECIMFWSTAKIDAAYIFELSLWCHHKPDLYNIACGFPKAPSFIPLLRNSTIYRNFRSPESERKGWLEHRPLLAKWVKEKSERLWITVLARTCHLQATDPRDYIYALLGCPLARPIIRRSLLQPDYTLSKNELFTRVAVAVLQDPVEGPWLLCAIGRQSRESLLQSVTPSWIPIWDTLVDVYDIAEDSFWYKAGGHKSPFKAEMQNESLLVVRGSIFDRVAWKSEGLLYKNFRAARSNAEPYIDTLWDQVDTQMTELGTSLQRNDFLMSLVKGFVGYDSCEEDWQQEHYNTYLIAARSKLVVPYADNVSEIDGNESARQVSLMERRLYQSDHYCIVVTSNGRVGLGLEKGIRVGDRICIFHGVSVPFVLAATAEGRFKIAAQAYIHGVMSGELIDRFEAEDIVLE